MGIRRTFTSFGLGLGLMYFLDPDLGRRRRALARDKLAAALNDLDDALETALRDANNRVQGFLAAGLSRYSGRPVPDEKLEERIRSMLGRWVSHPGAIEVVVSDGDVVLHGPILARDVDPLVAGLRWMRGVRNVRSELEVHEEPGQVPALQGHRRRRQVSVVDADWPPALRLGAGALGAWLMARCAARPTFSNMTMGTLGFGLFARAVTKSAAIETCAGRARRGFLFHKAINVNAPVETVFRVWSALENLPRFMTNVREIRDLGDGLSHWTVAGPLGTLLEWNSRVTAFEPNALIAWQTEPGAAVEHAGRVRFQANEEGGTTVDVHLTYNPPGGAFGHAATKFFGADPKSEMDADLLRMKTFVETGIPAHDAAAKQ